MRDSEIKFRAWDIESPAMLSYEECIDEWECGEFWFDALFRQDHYHCMMFTGFKDKNGKEVYYDDIYRDSFGPVGCNLLVTELTVAHWLIAEDKMNTPMERIEIIGNRWEHPELLGKAA